MKLIDGFIFYNEIDILFYRLSILYEIVDYFVIVEATKTFVGKPKPLYYQEQKERFEKFADKIIHIVDDELIEHVDNPWNNEYHQRNYIHQGIRQLTLEKHDLIMISDVDEIPDVHSLQKIKEENTNITYMNLEQDMYYYHLTCKLSDKWSYAKLLSFEYYVHHLHCSPQRIRTNHGFDTIKPGGWHLSYFGNPSFIRNKIENFGHQELNHEKYKNETLIENHIKNNTDLFLRPTTMLHVPIATNNYLPPRYEELLPMFLGE